MLSLKERLIRGAFVLGVVCALGFGAQAALAGGRVAQCLCDPDDPDRDMFCVECCEAVGSLCPIGAGGPRECICA